jgi:hypothetical protein
MARSPELLALLSKTSSFIGDADALLRTSVNRERQRASAIFESVDRTLSSARSGNITDTVASGGQALGQIARFAGFGPKAVGPVSELPLVQLVSQNAELRFVKRKDELLRDRAEAMQKEPGQSILGIQINPFAPAVANRFGPSEAGMRSYSDSEGKDAVDAYRDRVFPFKFENTALEGMVATPKSEIFVAYITNLAESITPSWTPKNYLGRSEAVHIYTNASRSLNIQFSLLATNPSTENTFTADDQVGYQIPVSNFGSGPLANIDPESANALMDNSISKADMWRKIDFLSALAYPTYDEEGRYDKAPFGRLTIGNLFVDQLFVATNITYSYEPLIWDINDTNSIAPMIINITMSLTLLHDSSPGILPYADGQVSAGEFEKRAQLAYTTADGTRRFYTRAGITGRQGEGQWLLVDTGTSRGPTNSTQT